MLFDIITSRDFMNKLEADYLDFKAEPDSARLALNCIITVYHLHEWVWGDWLNRDFETWKRLGIRDIDTFKKWLDIHCPGFLVIQSLTNGAKHFSKPDAETRLISGFGMGPYGAGPYGHPYLLIDHGAGESARLQIADQLIEETVSFWRQFFETYRPSMS